MDIYLQLKTFYQKQIMTVNWNLQDVEPILSKESKLNQSKLKKMLTLQILKRKLP